MVLSREEVGPEGEVAGGGKIGHVTRDAAQEIFFFFGLFRTAFVAYGSSQARG